MRPDSPRDRATAFLQLTAQLQHLLVTDPQLPSVLTPGWPGRIDAAALVDIRRRWRPHARAYWQAQLRSGN